MSPKVIDDATRGAREQELLSAALDVISDVGVSSFTIEKIVARVPYSKGTVYNHFSGKEDVLTALCNNCVRDIGAVFTKALTFDGNSREKMLATSFGYLLHSLLNPTKFMLVITAKTASIREKATQQRMNEYAELEGRLLGGMMELITTAVKEGDLQLPSHMSVEQVPFSVWSASFGTIALLHKDLDTCGFREELVMEREYVNHCNLMLDGLGWHPDSRTADWQASVQRMKDTVFAEEIAELKQRDAAIDRTQHT